MKTAAALLKTVPAALFYKNIKKFFLLKNAAALRTLFFETCNCARFRAISYVIKKTRLITGNDPGISLAFSLCAIGQAR